MATIIKGRRLAQLLQQESVRRSDQVMSARSMQAYLRYRLVIVEGEIRQIVRQLGKASATQPDALNGWSGAQPGAALAKSWTSLNYLLNARDSLRMTIEKYDLS